MVLVPDERGGTLPVPVRLQAARTLVLGVIDPRTDRQGIHHFAGIRHQQGMKESGIGAGVEPQVIRRRIEG
jgi:hypothetical protein